MLYSAIHYYVPGASSPSGVTPKPVIQLVKRIYQEQSTHFVNCLMSRNIPKLQLHVLAGEERNIA